MVVNEINFYSNSDIFRSLWTVFKYLIYSLEQIICKVRVEKPGKIGGERNVGYKSLTYLLTPWSRVLLEKLTSKLCS